jgi:hypothetical protein
VVDRDEFRHQRVRAGRNRQALRQPERHRDESAVQIEMDVSGVRGEGHGGERDDARSGQGEPDGQRRGLAVQDLATPWLHDGERRRAAGAPGGR